MAAPARWTSGSAHPARPRTLPGILWWPLVNAQGGVASTHGSGQRTRRHDPGNATVIGFGRTARERPTLRGLLGLAMQPVMFPNHLRRSARVLGEGNALLVVTCRGLGPRRKAGVQLGDLGVELLGNKSHTSRTCVLCESGVTGRCNHLRGGAVSPS